MWETSMVIERAWDNSELVCALEGRGVDAAVEGS